MFGGKPGSSAFPGSQTRRANATLKTLYEAEYARGCEFVAQVSLPLALVLAPSRRVGAVAAVGVAAWQWAMAASTVKPSRAAPLCLTRGLCSLAPLALADELPCAAPAKKLAASVERAPVAFFRNTRRRRSISPAFSRRKKQAPDLRAERDRAGQERAPPRIGSLICAVRDDAAVRAAGIAKLAPHAPGFLSVSSSDLKFPRRTAR